MATACLSGRLTDERAAAKRRAERPALAAKLPILSLAAGQAAHDNLDEPTRPPTGWRVRRRPARERPMRLNRDEIVPQQDIAGISDELRSLREEVAALRNHVSHIGHLVQLIEARGRRAPILSPHAKARLRQAASPFRRAARLIGNPRRTVSRLSAIYSQALKTSYRARRSGGGWRQQFRLGLFLDSLGDQISRQVFSRRPAIYTINGKHKHVSARRPRILHAIPNIFVGGSTQLIVDIIEHLGHKYDMHVMTSAVPPGASHVGMIVHNFTEPTSVEAMVDLMRKFDPELVHIHYWGDVDIGWYEKVFDAARKLNIKVVLNINTPVEPYPDFSIAHCVYVSEYVRERFGGLFLHETVIHPGIDLARFSQKVDREADAADTIGMVYRLEPDKLNLESIEVLIEVAKQRPATRIVVVGGGTLFDPFVERTRMAGVRDNFDFTGYVPYEALSDYYQMFSVFIAPVWKESFGQVTPFAMAMGLAVAGNKVGALSEILGSDEFLGESVAETARKIVGLLDAPDMIAKVGEENRARCLSNFAVDKMCTRYDAVYMQAMGRQSDDPMPGFPPAELFAPS
jgi:glycosyltransferase involved in cell wall biosynthesis